MPRELQKDDRWDAKAAERTLLEFLRRPGYRPIPQRELLHRLQVPGDRRPAMRRIIRRLIHAGEVRKVRGGRLVSGGRAAEAGRAGQPDGPFLALVVKVGRGLRAEPLDTSAGEPLGITGSQRLGAGPMELVRVQRLPASRRAGSTPAGEVLEVLGHLDDPGIDETVVTAKYGLAVGFPDAVEAEAEALPARAPRQEVSGRTRFDDPPPVTIDGETARDFDDAIAVEELSGGGYRLFVHIADVSHYVLPASEMDREAFARGTSVYFPGSVLPMLPERLSNDLCSLRPRCERLVQSVTIDFDSRGRVRRTRFADGVIRSAARLTYGQVGDFLDGRKRGHGVPARLTGMLSAANRLRNLLEDRRHERGSLDFDLPEPQILMDVEGAMTGITIEPRNRAHRMIEEFMIAANEAVATWLLERGAACLFRVHDPPDPDKLEVLSLFLARFGLELPLAGGSLPEGALQRLLTESAERPEHQVVAQVVLRSMKQARYSPSHGAHYGLASLNYCHFTSPIRRYPDLVVHRLLRAARASNLTAPEGLDTIAAACSQSERNAESAEREVLSWKKIAFIADRVGDDFDGVVTGVARFGLFVRLTENLVEGMVRVEDLGVEWFEHDEAAMELRGGTSGRRYRVGDQLRVRVVRVDRARLRVDLVLEGSSGLSRPRSRRRPRHFGPPR